MGIFPKLTTILDINKFCSTFYGNLIMIIVLKAFICFQTMAGMPRQVENKPKFPVIENVYR